MIHERRNVKKNEFSLDLSVQLGIMAHTLPPFERITRNKLPPNPPLIFMSKHSTLKATGTVGGKRSVLKRFERVKLMKERGQWKQGQNPIGLPKTKFES